MGPQGTIYPIREEAFEYPMEEVSFIGTVKRLPSYLHVHVSEVRQ